MNLEFYLLLFGGSHIKNQNQIVHVRVWFTGFDSELLHALFKNTHSPAARDDKPDFILDFS